MKRHTKEKEAAKGKARSKKRIEGKGREDAAECTKKERKRKQERGRRSGI